MKKLLLLAFFAALFTSVSGYAQTVIPVSDTIRNTTPVTAIIKAGSSYQQVSIQTVVTKVSGTVAGNAILYGSIDGINYKAIGADTLTLTNVASQNKIWYLGASKHYFYKVVTTGSGTMKATEKSWFLGK